MANNDVTGEDEPYDKEVYAILKGITKWFTGGAANNRDILSIEQGESKMAAIIKRKEHEAELRGRIAENDYHWHHQKQIENRANQGRISSYFLERNEFLTAPTTDDTATDGGES